MSKPIQFPLVESEEEYLEELRCAATFLSNRRGGSVDYYMNLMKDFDNSWGEYYEMLYRSL